MEELGGFKKIMKALGILSFLQVLISLTLSWSPLLTLNLPFNYGEGPILNQALQLAHFQNIYRANLSEPPWTISNYPPVYYVLQAPFLLLTGPDFCVGRYISVVAIVLSAILIGRISLKLFEDQISAYAAGLTFLIIPFVMMWGPMGRVDSAALFLSLLGIDLGVGAIQKNRFPWASVCILVLAVFTKPTCLVFGPISLAIWVQQKRNIRQSTFFLVTLATSVMLLGLMLCALTDFGFYAHTIAANINDLKLDNLIVAWQLLFTWFPFLIAAFLLAICLRMFRSIRSQVWPIVVAGFISSLFILKSGSDVNYLFDFGAAMCICFGGFVSALIKQQRQLLAILLAVFNLNWLFYFSAGLVLRELEEDEKKDIRALKNIVSTVPDPILSDEYLGLELLRGGTMFYQPFERQQLVKAGVWNQAPLLQMIHDKKFSIILINQVRQDLIDERWTKEMLSQIKESYLAAEKVGYMSVYRPRKIGT